MIGKYDVSNTEKEILEYLWQKGTTVKTGELLEAFNANGKGWKPQTLNTLLLRLNEIGLVKRERGAVSAAYTQQEYERMVAKDILETAYSGKLSNFVAALTGGGSIEQEEYEELKQMLDELK